MLKPVITRRLSNGRGLVHVTWTGMVWLQQGRPHGVMARPGEAFLELEDLRLIAEMLREFEAKGGRRPLPGTAVPL